MSRKSWSPAPGYPSSNGYAHSYLAPSSGSPAPTPGAPRVGTVSLPHPNSTPRHPSFPYDTSPAGASRILVLNPLLSYTGRPALCFNVVHDVRYIRLNPGCPPSMLQGPALSPPQPAFSLRVAAFPHWRIDVSGAGAGVGGVSVFDVLARVRDALNQPVSPQEVAAAGAVGAAAGAWFAARTRTDPHERALGVKRLDFLGQNVYLAGVSPPRDPSGCWDVHFCSGM